MFRTYYCITEEHALGIIAIAAVVCWSSNFIAFRLLRQLDTTKGLRQLGWQLAASFAVGAGIWSTHFIAMLGYDPGVVIGFDTAATLSSLVIAVITAAVGVLIFQAAKTPVGHACAGLVIGLGIASMHYVGMAGVLFPGRFIWNTPYVVASIVAGCALATVSLVIYGRQMTRWPILVAASLLTLAIAGLHFIAMGAAEAIPDPTVQIADLTLPHRALAFGIAAAMLMTLAFAALALFAERLRLSNEQLQAKTAQLDAALGNMSQGLCMYDAENRLVLSNARFSEIYNFPDDTVRPGIPFRDIIEISKSVGRHSSRAAQEYHDERVSMIAKRQPASFTEHLSDGCIISIWHTPLEDDGWVVTYEDVTERKKAEARIAHMAHHDALTSLPNRLLFQEEMERAISRCRRGERIALLCLDLDHFKGVNDALGHPIGDALLRDASERLLSCVRETDLVARLGGDEFSIIQNEVISPEQPLALASRLIEAFDAPFEIDGHQIVTGVSIGIALLDDENKDPDELFLQADMALYRVKTEERGTWRLFRPEMKATIQARRELEIELRQAFSAGQFAVYYQPLVDIRAETVTGFEALLRWNHPVRGLIAPLEFMAACEEIGLIIPLGNWVLNEACTQAMNWPKNTKVAVNLSPAQFKSPTLVLDVISALAASGLSAQRLELEITEAIMLQETKVSLDTLHQLRGLGVRIALDDFGTGYSSLGYMRKFPFDRIKIDRSFICDLPAGQDSLAIVRAVIGLSASFGIPTTAEGIENEQQFDRVRSEGCLEAQGFLFSPPRAAHELLDLIDSIPTRISDRRLVGSAAVCTLHPRLKVAPG